MRVCVFVFSPQKGLLVSMGKVLQERGHEVVLRFEIEMWSALYVNTILTWLRMMWL